MKQRSKSSSNMVGRGGGLRRGCRDWKWLNDRLIVSDCLDDVGAVMKDEDKAKLRCKSW